MKVTPARVAALSLVAVLAACNNGAETIQPSAPAGPADPLRAIAREQGAVQIVVELAVADPAETATTRRKLLGELGRGARVVERYEDRPLIVLEVTAGALDRLRGSPLVVGIHLDENR